MSARREAEQAGQARALREITDNFNPLHFQALAKQMAAERKIKFDEYVKAGFSESQALTLCKGWTC